MTVYPENVCDKSIVPSCDEYDFSQSELKIFGKGKVNKADTGIATITAKKESYMFIEL